MYFEISEQALIKEACFFFLKELPYIKKRTDVLPPALFANVSLPRNQFLTIFVCK